MGLASQSSIHGLAIAILTTSHAISNPGRKLPIRVFDVGFEDSATDLHLRITNAEPENYIALGYTWGGKPSFTKPNLHYLLDYKASFPIHPQRPSGCDRAYAVVKSTLPVDRCSLHHTGRFAGLGTRGRSNGFDLQAHILDNLRNLCQECRCRIPSFKTYSQAA
jgi:hypothetical protein